jgi:hypothetical protein
VSGPTLEQISVAEVKAILSTLRPDVVNTAEGIRRILASAYYSAGEAPLHGLMTASPDLAAAYLDQHARAEAAEKQVKALTKRLTKLVAWVDTLHSGRGGAIGYQEPAPLANARAALAAPVSESDTDP